MAAGIALEHSGWLDNGSSSFTTTWWIAAGGLGAWWWFWRGGHPAISAWLLLATVAATGGAWHDCDWEIFPRRRHRPLRGARADAGLRDGDVLTAAGDSSGAAANAAACHSGRRTLPRRSGIDGIRDGDRLAAPPPAAASWSSTAICSRLRRATEVQIFAQLRRPSPPMNPGEFDFAARARADGRLASLITQSPDCVTVIAPNERWSPWRIVDALRAMRPANARARTSDRDQAGTRGRRSAGQSAKELPYEETMPFFLTGTVHLLVVSGLNVAILATGLYALVWIGWLPRRVALALTMIAVVRLRAGRRRRAAGAAGGGAGRDRLPRRLDRPSRRGLQFARGRGDPRAGRSIPTQLFHTGTQLSFLCVAILIWVGQSKQFNVEAHGRSARATDRRNRGPGMRKLVRTALRWTWFLLLTSAAVWLVTLAAGALSVSRRVAGGAVDFAGGVAARARGDVERVHHVGVRFSRCRSWRSSPVRFAVGRSRRWWRSSIGPKRCPADTSGRRGRRCGGWSDSISGLWRSCLWGRTIAVRPLAGRTRRGVDRRRPRAAARSPLLPRATNCGARSSPWATARASCWKRPTARRCSTTPVRSARRSSPRDAVAGYLWDRGILRIDGADPLARRRRPLQRRAGIAGTVSRRRDLRLADDVRLVRSHRAERGTASVAAARSTRPACRSARSGPAIGCESATCRSTSSIRPSDGVVGSDNANSITRDGRLRRPAAAACPAIWKLPGLEDVIAERPVDCDVLMAPHHGSRRSDPPGFAAWSTPEWVVISGGADSDPKCRADLRRRGRESVQHRQAGGCRIHVRAATEVSASSLSPGNSPINDSPRRISPAIRPSRFRLG